MDKKINNFLLSASAKENFDIGSMPIISINGTAVKFQSRGQREFRSACG